MIERSQKVWSFSHLTFQEYLVAKWFGKQSSLENLAQHFVHKHWKEVCLLASEIVDEPQKAGQFLRKSKENIDISFIGKHFNDFLEQLHQKVAKCSSIYTP
ncbi:MAG: hypothetical protein RMY62_016245 [Nostoc sp. ZfuVER08]|uniref:Uncharacterized protein n=1 Tax=Nostoc punctiforme FACHB-252 TaxID=1357509 RepID=A0ABR8HB65_NOSPU|nr:hypothetical protein [Nostoc punctiforme]MBD2612556.1 hypothetical protein [Nostoc punctiforme FACHB-252]MDZ8012705.1 hypothetical protein [Nostoc sp. ZfuVER08]